MDFDINIIEKNIAERKKEITYLRSQIASMLDLNAELEPVICETDMERAKDIYNTIQALQDKIAADLHYQEAALQLLKAHNVPSTGLGNYNVGLHISNMQNEINHFRKSQCEKYLANQISIKECDTNIEAFERVKKDRIEELRILVLELTELAPKE